MPPAKAREEEAHKCHVPFFVSSDKISRSAGSERPFQVIWYAFSAFDEDSDKEVTVDKVLHMARLLEAGALDNKVLMPPLGGLGKDLGSL